MLWKESFLVSVMGSHRGSPGACRKQRGGSSLGIKALCTFGPGPNQQPVQSPVSFHCSTAEKKREVDSGVSFPSLESLSFRQVPWTLVASSASLWARPTLKPRGTSNSQCCWSPWTPLASPSPGRSACSAWKTPQVKPRVLSGLAGEASLRVSELSSDFVGWVSVSP